MNLWKFHGGVHPNGHKNLSNQTNIIDAPIPRFLVLPLLQHIGEPTEPIVRVGEKVLKGQIIAHCHAEDCSLMMSAPVHASSSGTVVAIEKRNVPHPSGLMATCIVIETDGKDEKIGNCQPIPNYLEHDPSRIRRRIARAGIVGLGGAGFPSHFKLKPEGIDTLILNGAECEPYITCDDRLMQEKSADIIEGALILKHVLGGAKHCIIAVEDNKPEAYQSLCEATANEEGIEVKQVPTRYPTGGERQLIQVLTGKEIGRSELPAQHGIVMHNVETARAVYRAVIEGRPLLSRIVTVTGSGVEQPQNFEVMLGSPMSSVIEQCGLKPNAGRLIMGGAMMGMALPNADLPVVKTTNCLLVSTEDDVESNTNPMPCIRCGACAEACPINLLPQQLYWYAHSKDFTKIQDYNLFDCIDCGCCSYVCPSQIPLVSYFRYAKSEVRTLQSDKQKADIARQRHEFREFRVQREKEEKAARHKKKAQAANKKNAISEAVERAKAKKQTAEKVD
ncbi:electron transport complex subunit RsxC [Candidatus Albibeggiatoa sp. nov. NOAA]|uniref:electron transport complex subunit RsxC n=1 Tax=Candidatus Albibeggiatoa sp. nov. NOAA TaxID=3162724 RepID=UPI003302F5F1|nr:electron transport complex subunit RsxC [Thiotrichaceae bacterium]